MQTNHKQPFNPDQDWALKIYRKHANAINSQLQVEASNEVIRNISDARKLILRAVRADYVDYVPMYACIYVNRRMQVLHHSIESIYNHKLTNAGLVNIINRAVATGSYGVILATNIISLNGQRETDMILNVGHQAALILEQHNIDLIDCFTFNSEKWMEGMVKGGLSYFNTEGIGDPTN